MISIVLFAKSMAGHTNHTTLVTVVDLITMVLLSKRMGAQEAHERMDMQISTIQKKANVKGQFFLRSFAIQ